MQVFKIKIDGKFATNILTQSKRGGGHMWLRGKRAEKLVEQYNKQNPPLPGMEPKAVLVTYELVEVKE